MNETGSVIVRVFVGVVAVWAALFGGVVIARVVRGLRRRRLQTVRQRLTDVMQPSVARARQTVEVDRLLRRLPRWAVERAIVDSQDEPRLRNAYMTHALTRWGARHFMQRARTRHARRWRRVSALFILAHAKHPRLLEVLRDAARDPDRTVAEAALRLLGRLADRRAAATLVDMLCDTDVAVAPSRIATLLDAFPLPITDLLLPLTEQSRPAVRFWGATLLRRYAGEARVAAAFKRLVEDEDPMVRKAALEALGTARSADLVSVAAPLVDDPVFYVRAHAIRAIAALGEPGLADLMAPALGDADWWVRLAAQESLTALGPSAGPALVPYLDSDDTLVRVGAAAVLDDIRHAPDQTSAGKDPHA